MAESLSAEIGKSAQAIKAGIGEKPEVNKFKYVKMW
jgi:hypothetical protein